MKRILQSVVLGGLIIIPVGLSAANEGHRPEDGPRRLLRVFPEQGVTHLPGSAIQHGLPKVLKNIERDARNAKSDNSSVKPGQPTD
jgi:hypothetical protein